MISANGGSHTQVGATVTHFTPTRHLADASQSSAGQDIFWSNRMYAENSAVPSTKKP
jgi:hypothetical protein